MQLWGRGKPRPGRAAAVGGENTSIQADILWDKSGQRHRHAPTSTVPHVCYVLPCVCTHIQLFECSCREASFTSLALSRWPFTCMLKLILTFDYARTTHIVGTATWLMGCWISFSSTGRAKDLASCTSSSTCSRQEDITWACPR